ncbi:MAG TPA: oxygenase MpaB family protein [Azospirillaceae bacterium]|nr:oxygenase MpaB family protein [Azospirillaceae bacterium]
MIAEGERTVDAAELERQLACARAAAAGSAVGLYGPGSMKWQVDREAALFLGAGRALLLQLAHPWVAAAVAQHSGALIDPIGRFHRTFRTVYAMVFGTLEQAVAAARQLHRRHGAIEGALPWAAGPFPQGSAYRANDLAALKWVHATLTDTAVTAHGLILAPLSPEARERYYAEGRRFAGCFGIPAEALPGTWGGFAAYVEAMHASPVLTVTPTARDIAHQLLAGAGNPLVIPGWYRALTAGLLPPPLREGFALSYGLAEEKAVERALGWLRRVYPMLPARLRYVGPYHEAMDRLSGRPRAGTRTQLLNRLWIGQRFLGSG